jgi:hypothetical protein
VLLNTVCLLKGLGAAYFTIFGFFMVLACS